MTERCMKTHHKGTGAQQAFIIVETETMKRKAALREVIITFYLLITWKTGFV